MTLSSLPQQSQLQSSSSERPRFCLGTVEAADISIEGEVDPHRVSPTSVLRDAFGIDEEKYHDHPSFDLSTSYSSEQSSLPPPPPQSSSSSRPPLPLHRRSASLPTNTSSLLNCSNKESSFGLNTSRPEDEAAYAAAMAIEEEGNWSPRKLPPKYSVNPQIMSESNYFHFHEHMLNEQHDLNHNQLNKAVSFKETMQVRYFSRSPDEISELQQVAMQRRIQRRKRRHARTMKMSLLNHSRDSTSTEEDDSDEDSDEESVSDEEKHAQDDSLEDDALLMDSLELEEDSCGFTCGGNANHGHGKDRKILIQPNPSASSPSSKPIVGGENNWCVRSTSSNTNKKKNKQSLTEKQQKQNLLAKEQASSMNLFRIVVDDLGQMISTAIFESPTSQTVKSASSEKPPKFNPFPSPQEEKHNNFLSPIDFSFLINVDNAPEEGSNTKTATAVGGEEEDDEGLVPILCNALHCGSQLRPRSL